MSDDDEEMVPFITKYSYPFATVIIAPDCIQFKKFNQKVVSYSGYHEVAYLHPSYFSPDTSVLNELGIKNKEDFFILRFVALKGHHDNGHIGISLSQKRELIKYLSNTEKFSSHLKIELKMNLKNIEFLFVRKNTFHSVLCKCIYW